MPPTTLQLPPPCNATYDGVGTCTGADQNCSCIFPNTCFASSLLCKVIQLLTKKWSCRICQQLLKSHFACLQMPPPCEATFAGAGICTGDQQACTCTFPNACNASSKLCQASCGSD